MRWPLLLVLGASWVTIGNAQLAAVFSEVDQSPDCHTWSSWGSCIWLQGPRSGPRANTYLDQLSPECQRHWFFNTVRRRFGVSLNNFFSYLKDITIDDKPCGMCSYRQSCGFGGAAQCHQKPWVNTANGRPQFCRCCCFPFKPVLRNNDYKCVHVGRDKAPPVPGLERLRNG